MREGNITFAYQIAKEQYAEHGVDVDAAMRRLESIPFQFTAGRGTTSEASRLPARSFRAEASRQPAIIPAKHGTLTSCEAI